MRVEGTLLFPERVRNVMQGSTYRAMFCLRKQQNRLLCYSIKNTGKAKLLRLCFSMHFFVKMCMKVTCG